MSAFSVSNTRSRLLLSGFREREVSFVLELVVISCELFLIIVNTHSSRLVMASKVSLTFANGDKLPAIGLGTWRAPDEEVEAALNAALEAGYRHIDCAPVYQNEKVIGKVFHEWIDSGRIQRSDLFVTTKLPPFGNRAADVERCLKKSLADLQLEYIDLYLIHVPFAVPYTEGPFEKDENGDIVQSPTDHIETWKVSTKGLTTTPLELIMRNSFNGIGPAATTRFINYFRTIQFQLAYSSSRLN